ETMSSSVLRASRNAPAPRTPARTRLRRRAPAVIIGIAVITAVLLFSLLLPIGSILRQGLTSRGLARLASIVTTEYGRSLLVHTLTLGVSVGVLGTAVAFLMAYVQVRVKIPGKRLLHFLSLLPVVS